MRQLPTHPASARDDARPPDACAGCGADAPDGRRRFLRDTLLSATGALLALGLTRTAADALPVRLVRGLAGVGRTSRYALPAADGVQIDGDAEVILVRWQGAVYAFALSCPHQNTALRWLERDGRFQCPKHKSRYRPDGTFIEGRATRGMDRFALARDGDGVVVDLARLHEQDADPAGWAAAVVRLA